MISSATTTTKSSPDRTLDQRSGRTIVAWSIDVNVDDEDDEGDEEDEDNEDDEEDGDSSSSSSSTLGRSG